jgi:hypothetical protein
MSLPDVSSLSNLELKTRFEALRRKESEVIADLVLYLSELDARGYYRDLGYGSLFSYLTQGLHYSEGAAQRRIQAARCLRGHPEVYYKLREGVLNLCTLSEIAKVEAFAQAKLLEDAQGKSKREVERLVAGVLPPEAPKKEAVRVHRVVLQAPAPMPLFSAPASPPPVAENPRSAPSQSDGQRGEERYTITLEVDKEFMKLLNEAKALGGGFKNAEVLRRALTSYVAKKTPKAKAPQKKSTSATTAPIPAKRYIPKSVRDAVYIRDGGRCTFVGVSGIRCSETSGLQIEHCQPFALGGGNDKGNLCLLCRSHNILRAEQVFGREKIQSYQERQRQL